MTGAFPVAALEAGYETALEAVRSAGTRGEELVAAWVKAGNAAAVAAVADRGEGGAKRAARRGLNVLRSRGVSVPTPTRVARLAGTAAEREVEARMLPPDAVGARFFVFDEHGKGTRHRACFVIIGADRRLLNVTLESHSRSSLEARCRVLPGLSPVRVPLAWARAEVARALRTHEELGIPKPLGLESAAPLLGPPPDSPVPHPFEEEGLVVADEDAREMARAARDLHAWPEFRGYLPEQRAFDEMLEALANALAPDMAPDATQQVVRDQIHAATDRYFSPQRREALVESLQDAALSVLARAGEAKALELAAVIAAVRSAGLITDPPHEIPFLTGYFEKALAVHLERTGGTVRVRGPAPEPPSEPASP